MLAALLNGERVADSSHALSVEERGLGYGDGVFETMTLRDGKIRFVDDHYERMRTGCARLRIDAPEKARFESDLSTLRRIASSGIVKIIVTRGAGSRGYRPTSSIVTRLAMLYPEANDSPTTIDARWCTTRFARNPQLAGIKHLNRLENVLAQAEWQDNSIAEGIMLDTEGEVISGTASNLFVVRNDRLITPDLRFCGVRGVMRENVLRIAGRLGLKIETRALFAEEVAEADEVILTNAIRGIRVVAALDQQRWAASPIAQLLIGELERAT